MGEMEGLAARFEEHRSHLRAVAYRMLGSLSEADDAVQEAWLRLSRSSSEPIENLGGWLTTVVSRVCLDMLRSRTARREEPTGIRIPDPIVIDEGTHDPEREALVAEAVGLALFVVLDELSPAERLAFVLHDTFDLPFDDVAEIVGRTPVAARKLASRARNRVRETNSVPDVDLGRQREMVDAFREASRKGDLDALLALLDPDCVLRVDMGERVASKVVRGADEVANQAVHFSARAPLAKHALVNGAAGLVVARDGRVLSAMGFTVVRDRIVALDILADPERLPRLGVG